MSRNGIETCIVSECANSTRARGLCVKHHTSFLRKGYPLPLPKVPSETLFWQKVNRDADGGCWEWTGGKSYGYGITMLDGITFRAHRVTFEKEFGPVADGLEIDHKCHNRACVNPDHLQAVTRKLNLENRKGAAANSMSGVRGVHWSRRYQRWQVEVSSLGRKYFGGRFADIREAERAAIDLRNSIFTNNLTDRIEAA